MHFVTVQVLTEIDLSSETILQPEHLFFSLNRPGKFRNSFHKGRSDICQMIREVSSKSKFFINKIVNLCKVQFMMSWEVNYHGP